MRGGGRGGEGEGGGEGGGEWEGEGGGGGGGGKGPKHKGGEDGSIPSHLTAAFIGVTPTLKNCLTSSSSISRSCEGLHLKYMA